MFAKVSYRMWWPSLMGLTPKVFSVVHPVITFPRFYRSFKKLVHRFVRYVANAKGKKSHTSTRMLTHMHMYYIKHNLCFTFGK